MIDITGYTRTSRPPVIVNGVTFFSYRTGIGRYALIDENQRAYVAHNYNKKTYSASVDKMPICGLKGRAKLFRTESAALEAAASIINGGVK